MSFLRHIRACNNLDRSHFLPFRVDRITVGLLRPSFAERLRQWPAIFRVGEQGVDLESQGGFEERSAVMAEVLAALLEQGVLSHLHGEQYVATPAGREQGMLLIDRAAAPYFGIRAFGQHLNGYVRTRTGLKMWIGRRGRDRINAPGRLDNLTAGGLPYGIGWEQNLWKECQEEAGIPPDLAKKATAVGAVTYNAESLKGCKPDTLYCYDLELSSDFVPHCPDGEMEEFYLLPVEEVMEIVYRGDEFKLNCNLVVIDFLIRHGYLGPEHDEYLELITGLHPPLLPLQPAAGSK
jgi:hypothetical protein